MARQRGRRDGWPNPGPALSPVGRMETGNCHTEMASFWETSGLHPRHCPLDQTAGKGLGQDTLSTHKPHPSNCISCLHQQHPPQPHVTNILPPWVPPSPSSPRTPKPTISPITFHTLAPPQPPLAPALQRLSLLRPSTCPQIPGDANVQHPPHRGQHMDTLWPQELLR